MKMKVCKQLNYRSALARYGYDYSERLVLDGQARGRNWSLVERTWHRDAKWHGGKFQYYLRVDLSEYYDNYDKLFYKTSSDDLAAMLMFSLPTIGLVRFGVHNQSPGLWENGFNPNIWLDGRIQTYSDEASRLRAVVSTGFDLEDPRFFLSVANEAIYKAGGFISRLAGLGPAGTPYVHWWGNEEPPPPREPKPLEGYGIIEAEENP